MIYSVDDVANLEEILSRLETIYAPTIDAEEYQTEGIQEVVQGVVSYIDSLENEDEMSEMINASALSLMSELSYLVHKASCFGLQIIVFDNFPNAIQISQFVFKLTRLTYLDRMTSAEYKEFLTILYYIDEERPEHKYGLPYRVLKLLFIMTFYRAYANTSILSKFILHQIALAAGIDA